MFQFRQGRFFIFLLLCVLFGMGAQAASNGITPISQISQIFQVRSPAGSGTSASTTASTSTSASASASTTAQNLPYFVHQNHSGLTQVSWTIRLPASLSEMSLPALLVPQPVQGAVYTIDKTVIYELPGSDQTTLRHWYQPALISIPAPLLQRGQETVVHVTQTGHLRGWFVSPMFAGELQDLRKYFTQFTFISQTLYTTINFLSIIIGIFFLIIGAGSKSKSYFYGGMTTLTWSILISVALTNDLPTAHYFLWRMGLYACTGLLIYFVSLFTIDIFGHKLPRSIQLSALAFLNLGWIIYAIAGPDYEKWLDVIWTGLAVCIYVLSAAWVIFKALKQHQYARVLPIALHWVLTSILAFHDYVLQSGALPFSLSGQARPLWIDLLLQPIYLTHIALPVFVIMAMWLLIKDHAQKIQNELRHVQVVNEQRERIVNDIHDGVGSRINLLLWSLRTKTPQAEQVESELQRCMEELRFAINPSQAGHETLHKALSDLCGRLKIQAANDGVVLGYQRSGLTAPVPSEVGLHLYKATQEVLSNALRHSQATTIQVALHQEAGQIYIEVVDDGTGIPDWDESSQTQRSQTVTSMGLKSLFHRIKSKSGQVHITSSTEGTRVRMTVLN